MLLQNELQEKGAGCQQMRTELHGVCPDHLGTANASDILIGANPILRISTASVSAMDTPPANPSCINGAAATRGPGKGSIESHHSSGPSPSHQRGNHRVNQQPDGGGSVSDEPSGEQESCPDRPSAIKPMRARRALTVIHGLLWR